MKQKSELPISCAFVRLKINGNNFTVTVLFQ